MEKGPLLASQWARVKDLVRPRKGNSYNDKIIRTIKKVVLS
jgi:hypothetical protein